MQSKLVKTLAIVTIVLTTHGYGSPLSPGSDAPECNNMLKPGATIQCNKEATKPDAPMKNEDKASFGAAPSNKSNKRDEVVFGGVSEAEIDDFLANHGKPPRAAVRALLNPSDDNIAAMAAEEKRRQVVAAYVAQRWTELQQGKAISSSTSTLDAYTTLPMFVGMRLLLLVTPDCKECAMAARELKALVEENPVIDSRLVVVSDDESAALNTLLQFGTSLPVSTVSIQQAHAMGWTVYPSVEITDIKSKRQRTLTNNLNAVALQRAVIEMRKTKTATRQEGK